MLHHTQELCGHKLSAIDGDIGQIRDFYFDDKNWIIRYLVAETGSWLTNRLVLLSPHAFGKWDHFEKTLHIKLSKTQIQNSPSIESHQPVSQQDEIAYHSFYGWPAYWNGGAIWGLGGHPVIFPSSKDEIEAQEHPHKTDKNLQSIQDLTGYHIQSGDEPIGQMSGFLVDDRSWAICKLIIETGHWYSGRKILISPKKVEWISYEESKVFVHLNKAEIEHAPIYDFAKADAANPFVENKTT